jgi:hypothetical protein
MGEVRPNSEHLQILTNFHNLRESCSSNTAFVDRLEVKSIRKRVESMRSGLPPSDFQEDMSLHRRGILALALTAYAAGPACAQGAEPPAPQVTALVETTITLQSGDVLKGTIKSGDKDSVVLVHPILGELHLRRSTIANAEPALPPPPPPPAPVVEVTSVDREKAAQEAAQKAALEAAKAAEAAKVVAKAPVVVEKPSLWEGVTRDDEKSFLLGWARSAELGMNTSSGNSDTFSLRANVSLRRGTKKMATSFDASCVYARDNNGESARRGEARARNDFQMGDTNWQLWGAGSVEFDKHTPWSARVSFSTGPAYTFVKNPETTLVGRVGLGGYREMNGGNNDVVANGVAAFDLSQKLNERATLYANTEIYPDLADLEEVRSVSRTGVTYLLDPESKTTLKFGAEHRYNSDSGPRDSSDVNMYMTLGFTF